MLLWIGIILLALWVFGFLVIHLAGFVIQIALIAAVVFIVWHLIKAAARRL